MWAELQTPSSTFIPYLEFHEEFTLLNKNFADDTKPKIEAFY
jgi:hypothetical protein